MSWNMSLADTFVSAEKEPESHAGSDLARKGGIMKGMGMRMRMRWEMEG
jgi:hypothetical protein